MLGLLRNGTYLLMLIAALSGCQQSNSAKTQFQADSEAQMKALTAKYSNGFVNKNTRGARGTAGDWNSSVAPWGQGYYGGQLYYPQVDVRARRCYEMLNSIPKTRATYGIAMIQAARCFNSLFERNPLVTFGYNNGTNVYQNNFAYGNGWPAWGGFNTWGTQQFQVFQSVLPYGYAQGQ